MWKIVCAILGYILAGFVGALLGFFVGGVIDKAQTGGAFSRIRSRADVRLQQGNFFSHIISFNGAIG